MSYLLAHQYKGIYRKMERGTIADGKAQTLFGGTVHPEMFTLSQAEAGRHRHARSLQRTLRQSSHCRRLR